MRDPRFEKRLHVLPACFDGFLLDATSAPGAGIRLWTDLLAALGPLAEGRGLRAVAPPPARRAEHGRRARLESRMRGRLPRPGEKGSAATGPSPVDRRKTGSKHHLICDGNGTPLHVITTAANVNDITQTINLVDGIPPAAGRPGRPRRRSEAVLGDKAYDSKAVRLALRRRRILPVISRKGAPNIKGLGKLRYVVERTFALLHQFKRLAVRWERRPELHDAFLKLASSLICWRRLKRTGSARSVDS
ncbi:IS5 family transposase [Streptomyces sp. NPDC059906]|uniref:IS5 family transposase n=1 Tax=Streptomyces sp. NPDC059906 TaxID=3346997 RepID=UPI003660B62D